ncbi:winged helix-turn-helix transcriptional regulator [Mesorhizobium sp. ZC-5]|uniref:winged helix-turn-helix transcriptional regulator n=1 Tax=Mesorhizobium sp. ZC-5 TaxID=2986066 RepID=UPI0021E7AC77|nr:winged helix-turn-helix transcriptional regulator [Mesorhizobium sp. ZC-5]MCV3243066.1 winged helix-turn-helix transcriptional regulator [Mesorhizobium sp. ZC-5]
MKLEKITGKSPRSYEDACATAHALDLLGERWALLVMRELMLGPRRFGDLRASLPAISANVLTQRLEGLEGAGVVRRRKLPPPASVQVYELTEWGLEAEPILLSLGKWAVRSPRHDPTLPLSPVALMLSFRAKFEAGKARGLDILMAFRFGAESFSVGVMNGVLITERGEPQRTDAVVSGSPSAIAGLAYGKLPLAELEQQGALEIAGERTALQRFADLFEMPPKAG